MNPELARKSAAEAVGTAFLVMAIVGSGIAAARRSPTDGGLQLLENSVVTAAVLVALIVTLQPVSAAFNPIVTLIERTFGVISTLETVVLIAAQVVGGVVGTIVANLMFGLPAVTLSTQHRSGSGVLLAEVVATLGLLLVIFGSVRSGRSDRVGFIVGGYILGAYWFTSSTSFANPAVTIARMFSNSFAGIAPGSAPAFIAMQMIGGVAALALIRVLYPSARHDAASLAQQEVRDA